MTNQTLLGFLAHFGSFSSQSEVLCTQGLAYLLQTYDGARSAMAEKVRALTGLAIDDSLSWYAESVQGDKGRPDLEACDDDHVPLVKIEAKLGAPLSKGQLESYVLDLQERNQRESVMLVLVPETRITEAADVTAAALKLEGPGPWRVADGHQTGVAVVSWDQLFEALHDGENHQFRHELEQLRAMYRVLSGDFIAPLADKKELREWKKRETDFINLVDKVTRRLTTQHRVYPMQSEIQGGVSQEDEPIIYRMRYVCCSTGKKAPCFSIGVRDSFAKWLTPIWMRFHKDTGDFIGIRQRIKASELRALDSGGHVWIPLDLPINVSGDRMIAALVEQAEEVLGVAYPSY